YAFPHTPTCPSSINDRAYQKVVSRVYEDIAVGFCSMENSSSKAHELETHDFSIALVRLKQELGLVSHPGEDGANQREALWTRRHAVRHHYCPFHTLLLEWSTKYWSPQIMFFTIIKELLLNSLV